MLLYRVEHPESKLGPYVHGSRSNKISEMVYQHNDDPDNHPSPRNDIGRFLREDGSDHERCAFTSRDQLVEWFGEWLPALAEDGFHCVKMQVNTAHVIVGSKQAIYVANKAIPISAISLKELL